MQAIAQPLGCTIIHIGHRIQASWNYDRVMYTKAINIAISTLGQVCSHHSSVFCELLACPKCYKHNQLLQYKPLPQGVTIVLIKTIVIQNCSTSWYFSRKWCSQCKGLPYSKFQACFQLAQGLQIVSFQALSLPQTLLAGNLYHLWAYQPVSTMYQLKAQNTSLNMLLMVPISILSLQLYPGFPFAILSCALWASSICMPGQLSLWN